MNICAAIRNKRHFSAEKHGTKTMVVLQSLNKNNGCSTKSEGSVNEICQYFTVRGVLVIAMMFLSNF
jgi:hypothetical protein